MTDDNYLVVEVPTLELAKTALASGVLAPCVPCSARPDSGLVFHGRSRVANDLPQSLLPFASAWVPETGTAHYCPEVFPPLDDADGVA